MSLIIKESGLDIIIVNLLNNYIKNLIQGENQIKDMGEVLK